VHAVLRHFAQWLQSKRKITMKQEPITTQAYVKAKIALWLLCVLSDCDAMFTILLLQHLIFHVTKLYRLRNRQLKSTKSEN
jgi:hypothetical protein